jgi:nucleoside-diphosphate-sugar epimerase
LSGVRKIFVTGATGFTGGHLCRHLREAGHDVVALVRPGSRREGLVEMGVRSVEGNLRDAASLRKAMDGSEVVYHLAAAFREANLPDTAFFEVNVKGTENMIRAAADCGVSRFVHASTIGVHGDTGKTPATEDSPFSTPDVYCESKLQGELLARRLFEELGMAGSVFRPMGIYGPRDTRFLKLFKSIRHGRFRMIGSGETFYQMTYIDDICRGIILCGEHPNALGEVFILAGDSHTTLNELVQVIADAVGTRVSKWQVPVAPVMAAARICDAVFRPLGLSPPIYPRRVEFFIKDRAADSGKVRRLLGWRPEVDLVTGVSRTAEWYARNGWL